MKEYPAERDPAIKKAVAYHVRVNRNCLIILMSVAGDTIASIAEQVGCTTFTGTV